MRRIFLIITLFLVYSAMASAVPALPGTYTYTQPDGTVIRLRNHGDEWYHWTTDEYGRTVEMDHVGYFRVVQRDHRFGIQQAKARRAQANERRRAQYNPVFTTGTRHIPVVLVYFKNLDFCISNPQQAFDILLNQQGYSDNGGKGSVRDYYVDNSSQAFTPVFDVFAPVPLSKNYAAYDGAEPTALIEACKALDSSVDFSQYDANNDGYVDMILFYFAGYNQAEGGPEDTIWPHQGGVYSDDLFDGLKLGTYFCTSELRFNADYGQVMCGIGTTCHEFAHSLGLPDFYDTDYEKNGTCTALASYSMMCNGSYNSNSNIPAGLTSLERDMLGWLSGDGIVEITSAGTYTLPPVQQNKAYRTNTASEGEYFLYECRAGTGWDSPLPTGVLICHVDQSERMVGDLRAMDLWNNTNSINCYGDHPCYTIVPSKDPTALLFDDFSLSQMIWKNNKSFSPKDWDGQDTGIDISGISYSGSQGQMKVTLRSVKGLQGKVLSTAGSPLQGATVRIGSLSATTNASGEYSLSLSGVADGIVTVEVSCSGYQSLQEEMNLGRFLYTHDFVLLRNGETPVETLQKYTTPFSGALLGIGATTLAVASYYSAAELADHVGKKIQSIDFYYGANTASAAYVIVEKGPNDQVTSLLKYPVDNLVNGWNYVDVSSEDVTIPSGADLYIGFHVEGADNQWCVAYESVSDGTGAGALRIMDYPQHWFLYDDFNPYISATLKAEEEPEEPWVFPTIDNPGNGHYVAGTVFPLKVNDVPSNGTKPTWFYDGTQIYEDSITLTKGTHLLQARIGYTDASVESIVLLLTVD